MEAPGRGLETRTLAMPSMNAHRAPNLADETLAEHWTRRVKTNLLRGARLATWVARPAKFPSPVHASAGAHLGVVIAEERVSLRRTDASAEPLFEEGKRVNLALAAPAFDGLRLGPDRPLSFWRTLGRVTEARGYRHGMELRGGCIVPAVGGGLCLLSNALFALAARAGFRIIERHGHSLEAVPPVEGALWGIDATVFWPYVDLRFAPDRPVALSVRVDDDVLVVRALAAEETSDRFELLSLDERIEHHATGPFRVNRVGRRREGTSGVEVIARNRRRVLDTSEQRRSCLTCNETDCHSHVTVPAVTR